MLLNWRQSRLICPKFEGKQASCHPLGNRKMFLLSRWPHASQCSRPSIISAKNIAMASAPTRPSACSFFGNGKINCGELQGKEQVTPLTEWVADVGNHLKNYHLSREKVTDYELILARVGNFNLPLDEIRKLTICPKHRHNLGQYGRPLKTCQYPDHEGRKIALHCKNPMNWQMAQKIQMVLITPVQVSRVSFFLFCCCCCCCLIVLFFKYVVTRSWKQLSQGKTEKKTNIKTKIRARLNILNIFRESYVTQWVPSSHVTKAHSFSTEVFLRKV